MMKLNKQNQKIIEGVLHKHLSEIYIDLGEGREGSVDYVFPRLKKKIAKQILIAIEGDQE